jgi:cytochrome c-type biogenesis protein CcmH
MNSKRNSKPSPTPSLREGCAIRSLPLRGRVRERVFIFLSLFIISAFSIDQKLDNPSQERQARELFQDVKCLVCKGESLAESNADMAVDMREMIRGKIAGGQTPAEIKADLVEKFGEQVLQTPPMDDSTYLLWFFPVILLTIGGFFIIKRSIKP